MSHIDPEVTIADNLEQPKSGVSDGQAFTQHSISEQIKGAKFLSNKSIRNKKRKGLIFNVFNTPGTV